MQNPCTQSPSHLTKVQHCQEMRLPPAQAIKIHSKGEIFCSKRTKVQHISTCAKSPKIFCGLGAIIPEQPYHNPPHILPHRIPNTYVEVHFGGDCRLHLSFLKFHHAMQSKEEEQIRSTKDLTATNMAETRVILAVMKRRVTKTLSDWKLTTFNSARGEMA